MCSDCVLVHVSALARVLCACFAYVRLHSAMMRAARLSGMGSCGTRMRAVLECLMRACVHVHMARGRALVSACSVRVLHVVGMCCCVCCTLLWAHVCVLALCGAR